MATSSDLFPTRRAATGWIAGLACFWGGAAVLGRSEELSGPQIPGILAMACGGVLIALGWDRMIRTRTGRGLFAFWGFDFRGGLRAWLVMVESAMPWTLASAGRTAGLNGPFVAGVLYSLLLIGLVRM
jgi:hypothetical protein